MQTAQGQIAIQMCTLGKLSASSGPHQALQAMLDLDQLDVDFRDDVAGTDYSR